MHRILLSAILWLAFAAGAGAAPPAIPPPAATSANSTITPTTSTTAQTLGSLTNPMNYQVPRTNIHMFKLWDGSGAQDTSGNFASTKTAFVTLEIPDDAYMAQLVLENFFQASYQLTSACISGSSELAVSGYTGASPGVTPYDGSGNALTSCSVFGWGNGGVDTLPPQGFARTAPTGSGVVNYTTNAQTLTSSTVLNFSTSGFTCPADGSTIYVISSTSTANPVVYPYTTTAYNGCNAGAGTITMSSTARSTIPSGTVVYFAPPSFTVPATTSQPLTTKPYYSDWAPLQTYARLDGPIYAGMKVLNSGTPLSGTVSSVTSTAAVMSANLASDIPPGTSIQVCQAPTLSAQMTPNLSLQFASNSNIEAGQLIGTPLVLINQGQPGQYQNYISVASVSTSTNTTVTLSEDLPELNGNGNWGSGTTFNFVTPVTVTANAAAAQAILFVSQADAAKLQTGWLGWASTGAGSSPIAGTISAINTSTGQITMSSNLNVALTSGEAIAFYFTAASNATYTTPIQATITSAVPNLLPGMTVVNSAFPSQTLFMSESSSTALNFTLPPSTTVASSSTIYLCNTVTTAGDSPAGQPNINFATTAYKNRLVTVRLTYAGTNTNANFWPPNPDLQARLFNIPGTPWRETGGTCTTANAVINFTAISNTGGGCGTVSSYVPFFALKFYTARRGVDFAVVGDSHFEGDTTIGTLANFSTRACAIVNNPGVMPCWPANLAWGGQPSSIYGPFAMDLIQDVHPSVVAIQLTTPNDPNGNAVAVSNMQATAYSIASYVQSYGGLPIVTADYFRQKFGCTYNATTNETVRLAAEAQVNSTASAGVATFDPNPLIVDPNNPNYFAPTMSNDCIHANDNGHGVLAPAYKAIVGAYLRY